MSGVSEAQLAQWQAAVGREISEEEVLDPLALRRFGRAVGRQDENDRVPLPHWAFFLPCPHDDEIGPDGHPRRGGFLPDVTLPRRMFAASEIEFHGELELSTKARQTSRVAELTHKSGRSGDLVFAKVEKLIEQGGNLRVREVQTYVYREDGAPSPMPEPAAEAPDGGEWKPDEVNLFRFSAATYNGHRIHYDKPYTTVVEGYPALVIHGPFTAAKLAALAMEDGPLASFSFRAMAPLFLGQPVYLRKADEGLVEAVRCDGVTAMQAKAAFSSSVTRI
ncbi:hypothetical protein [Qipengyuania aquimaris]|uniref:N-terminal of MaoC-like dehydratase domain-containing protein n=1 Tax=Qipengyuania aquimaris TaxID=255984 RepID=A0A9Q3XD22_9SPHN|nr:hypothetical protein [Qipengyuania aquimaris]MBY6218064.1 hypothetical protein [Qipengyuania aquimaris]